MSAKPPPAPCPVCRKPQVPDYRPFCSRRCADVDLARWLRGDYAIPGRDGEAEAAPPDIEPS
jgi:uncharacterized protein